MNYLLISFIILLFSSCKQSCSLSKESLVATKKVFFVNIKDNQQISSPFLVKFGVSGMSVRKALEDVSDKTSGHHHILIDHPQGYIENGQVIPMDDKHIHYGQGQTEGMITLSEGKHTLSLQFADGAHLSYGKEMAHTIMIEVVNKN